MTNLVHRHACFVARFARERRPPGCVVELEADGTAVLVVDGERLFHFPTLLGLIEHYAPPRRHRSRRDHS